MKQKIQIIMDIVLATIKIDFGYYEKLFWHFEFGNVNLLTNVILANMYGLRVFSK